MITDDLNEKRAVQLVDWYGDGRDGTSPTKKQWLHLMERPEDMPVTFVNFFKMRQVAQYGGVENAEKSGEEAFSSYADISVPAVAKVGGKFVVLAPFETTFFGPDEDWDLIAVGSYPNAGAALDLYEDPNYRAAFVHRKAGCYKQKILVCTA